MAKYDIIGQFSDGLARVYEDGKWGFIDETGNKVLSLNCSYVTNFYGGFASVEQTDDSKKWGIIDKTGKFIISNCESVDYFYDGLARVCIDKKWGYIDMDGNIKIPCQYERAHSFSDGLAWIHQKGKDGIIDRNGEKIMLRGEMYMKLSFSEGLSAVRPKKQNKYGYINRMGEIVIPCQFYSTYGFSNGIAIINDIKGNYGCIDKSGNIIIPCMYRRLKFNDGLIVAELNGTKYFFNNRGNLIYRKKK